MVAISTGFLVVAAPVSMAESGMHRRILGTGGCAETLGAIWGWRAATRRGCVFEQDICGEEQCIFVLEGRCMSSLSLCPRLALSPAMHLPDRATPWLWRQCASRAESPSLPVASPSPLLAHILPTPTRFRRHRTPKTQGRTRAEAPRQALGLKYRRHASSDSGFCPWRAQLPDAAILI